MVNNPTLQYGLDEINSMEEKEFIAIFGCVFEDSPWVAQGVLQERPFESLNTLKSKMSQQVETAGEEKQKKLLCAHPELGTSKKLTRASASEQKSAGITGSAEQQLALLNNLNKQYRDKFDFPFIVAVKGMSTDEIIETMQRRLSNSSAEEFNECLNQVYKIAAFRLDDLLKDE